MEEETDLHEHIDPDYLQEISKQLRGIYYLLVLGSTAIVLATTALPERSLDRAIQQLEALIYWTDNWNATWMDSLAQDTLSPLSQRHRDWPAHLPQNLSITLNTPPDMNSPVFDQLLPLSTTLTFYHPTWTLRGGNGYRADGAPPFYQSESVRSEPFKTVAEARNRWNNLTSGPRVNWLSLPRNPIAVVVKPSDVNDTHLISEVTIEEAPSGDTVSPALTLIATPDTIKQLIGQRLSDPMLGRGAIHNDLVEQTEVTHSWFVSLTETGQYLEASNPIAQSMGLRVHVPLKTFRVKLEAQRWLLDNYINREEYSYVEGEFEYTFAELSRHSRGLDQLPLRELKSYLDDRLIEVGRDVQAFGLTFRGDALGTWGIAILGALQLYFAISFRQLVALRRYVAWDFPWLALYDDGLAKLGFVLTAFVVPLGIVLLLAFESQILEQELSTNIAKFAGVITSILASAWGLILFSSMRAAPLSASKTLMTRSNVH